MEGRAVVRATRGPGPWDRGRPPEHLPPCAPDLPGGGWRRRALARRTDEGRVGNRPGGVGDRRGCALGFRLRRSRTGANALTHRPGDDQVARLWRGSARGRKGTSPSTRALATAG